MGREIINFAVLGAGSWGTALAMLLADNGHRVTLWTHLAEEAEALERDHRNTLYLPGLSLPDSLRISHDLGATLAEAEVVLIVVPSHAFRETLIKLKPHLTDQHKLAWGTKGLEPGKHKLLHQIAEEELGDDRPMAAISGPTFAREVAQKLPGAVTVASHNSEYSLRLARALHNDYFRAYTSQDMVGVEVGGAVKNVLAIAAGTADGLGFGANARAALIARGVAEIMRLGVILGAQQETFMGLTGLGDLVLTCTDDQSRNRRLGLAMGQGKSKEEAMATIGQVVEGVNTANEIHALAQRLGVELPISEQVYKVLYEGISPQQAVQALMERAIKAELD